MTKRLAAIGVPLALAAFVLAPLYLDQPFAPQTSRSLAAAYYFRRWSPIVTVVAGVFFVVLALRSWDQWRSRSARLLLVGAIAVTAGAVWFARVNAFEWMFNPVPHPRFVEASRASFVEPRDLVLAVDANGDRAAYPIRQLAYHHLVNDTIGGVPAVVTY